MSNEEQPMSTDEGINSQIKSFIDDYKSNKISTNEFVESVNSIDNNEDRQKMPNAINRSSR